MTALAGKLNIVIDQGATYSQAITWNDSNGAINNTGFTARMQVRATVPSASTVVSLTDGSGITLGGADGIITVALTATETAAITEGKYVYDLELVNGSDVYRVVMGTFTVRGEVTR
jgi:hypothetical protein